MSRSSGNYRNPCLTMHQPWASLLVHGIKRIEGRSWPAPITGRLWIHAAGKVPEPDTIKAMEDFYREIYAVNGITDLQFPQHYPVSRLLGCVEVVGCVTREELVSCDEIPEGVRLEGQTDFCWLCEKPQKLIIPFEMRGRQGVYNLERKVYEGAVRGLTRVTPPLAVEFRLPNPRNPVSLKPGSLAPSSNNNPSSSSEANMPESLVAAIAGARAAATQFSKSNGFLPVKADTRLSKNNGFQPIKESADTWPSKSNGYPTIKESADTWPSKSNGYPTIKEWAGTWPSKSNGYPTIKEWRPISSGTRNRSEEVQPRKELA